MKEIVFSIREDEDGGYVAKTRLEKGSIVTQGDTIAELKMMILDAVEGYFFNKTGKPERIRLKFEEEVLELA